MNNGQTSLELLLLIGAIVGLAVFFATYYSDSQSTTTALALAKNRFSEILNQVEPPSVVKTISARVDNAKITLTVITVPVLLSTVLTGQNNSFFLDTANQIVSKTGFSCVTFLFNNEPEINPNNC